MHYSSKQFAGFTFIFLTTFYIYLFKKTIQNFFGSILNNILSFPSKIQSNLSNQKFVSHLNELLTYLPILILITIILCASFFVAIYVIYGLLRWIIKSVYVDILLPTKQFGLAVFRFIFTRTNVDFSRKNK